MRGRPQVCAGAANPELRGRIRRPAAFEKMLRMEGKMGNYRVREKRETLTYRKKSEDRGKSEVRGAVRDRGKSESRGRAGERRAETYRVEREPRGGEERRRNGGNRKPEDRYGRTGDRRSEDRYGRTGDRRPAEHYGRAGEHAAEAGRGRTGDRRRQMIPEGERRGEQRRGKMEGQRPEGNRGRNEDRERREFRRGPEGNRERSESRERREFRRGPEGNRGGMKGRSAETDYRNREDRAAEQRSLARVKHESVEKQKTQEQDIREIQRRKRIRKARKENQSGLCCPYMKKCGGCEYLGMDYADQLKEKQRYVRDCIGDLCELSPIIGMENPYHYRNKVHAAFDIVKKEFGHGNANGAPGTVISGVYAAGTHDVINIDSCLIEDELSSAIIRDIRGLLRSFKIKTYDEDTGYGLLRHVLVRRGYGTGDVMVVLVLASPILPSKNNFVKAIRKLHPEITTVVINVNEKDTSMVLGERNITVYGRGYIEDTLCGCTFRISPDSFYQVNPVQTEILYRKAISCACLTGKETVIDAYCGIGTIGLIAAADAKEVIGVELNQGAVRDAVTNAKRNQIKNARFYNADAAEFMEQIAQESAAGKSGVDVIFLDPPRAGCEETLLNAVAMLRPERVVYVSCNPETLARDLKILKKKGYRAVEGQAVDMFPWTAHTECVVGMQRKHS